MCTLLLYYKMFPGAPVLLLGNRDELNDRPWEPPRRIGENPGVFGPVDTAAGGTWLGVNEFGVVVAITNHFGTLTTKSSMCSRGFVVWEALKARTANEARRSVESLGPRCKFFSVLVADAEESFLIDHGGADNSQTYALMPGPHVVTNARFRDGKDRKAALAREMMAEIARNGPPTLEECAKVLGDHVTAPGERTPMCVHPPEGSKFATVSSSIIELGEDRRVNRFLFAGGPPCRTPFTEFTPEF